MENLISIDVPKEFIIVLEKINYETSSLELIPRIANYIFEHLPFKETHLCKYDKCKIPQGLANVFNEIDFKEMTKKEIDFFFEFIDKLINEVNNV